jgi:hypothetical protein
MLMMIMVVLIFSWAEKFGAFFRDNIFDPMHEKITATFGGMILFWILVSGTLALVVMLLYLFRKPLGRIGVVRKIAGFLRGILDGLKTIYTMKRKWEFLFHSLLIWFLYIMMTWVVVFSVKETSSLTFVDGIFLLVIGGLGMSAPVTAGFGAYHWIVSRGLVFVYGLTLEQGGAYAILSHESSSLFTILLGATSYFLLMVSLKKKSPETT